MTDFGTSTGRITRIVQAQSELLDHSGHVHRGLPRSKAVALIAEINDLRVKCGWPPLDMRGRWRR